MSFDENQNNQDIIYTDNIILINTQFNNIPKKRSIKQSVQDESSHSGQTMFKVAIIRTALFFPKILPISSILPQKKSNDLIYS
jgi:hypothetical protein